MKLVVELSDEQWVRVLDGTWCGSKEFFTAAPLEKVLEDIKAEIDRQYKWLINTRYTIRDVDIAFGSIFRTIDKYKAESED